MQRGRPSARRSLGTAALTVGALGVVFGDIGTSPLYAFQTVFSADSHAVPVGRTEIYGVVSLIFWAITIIVSIEFVLLIMKADNEGEGGIMALTALIERISMRDAPLKFTLAAMGVFGASLFYGDGMITPAISVLSAVEGVSVATPSLDSVVVPVSLVILTLLFAAQRFGTGAVGRLFGPVMIVWFASIGVIGAAQVISDPVILKAISPTYAISYFTKDLGVAFFSLGSVVLAVTGAEALYADMGHFGRGPISRAWFLVAFPALALNYLGQGSLVLESPQTVSSPFFLLVPHWGRIAMVILATAATVIASQAVISGAYSLTRQAIQLGYLPRLVIRQTSDREYGQIFVPAVNAILFVSVIALVIGFGSSTRLASAYGIAVTATLAIDTALFFIVVHRMWGKPLWLSIAGAAAFGGVIGCFLIANLPKVIYGGWVPLVVGGVIFVILLTWQRGRVIVTRNREQREGDLREFVAEVHETDPPIIRVPGTAVFLNPNLKTTPLAMRSNVEHNGMLHRSSVVVAVETMKVPHVDPSRRILVDDLGFAEEGISHLRLRFGFKDEPDVPATLRQALTTGLETDLDLDHAVYFLSRIEIVATEAPGMAGWRKHLFTAISRNAANPIEYFRLPIDRTVITGSRVGV
ncbi:MAG: potassium transporter Kup [Solirubrobacterales bacterium]